MTPAMLCHDTKLVPENGLSVIIPSKTLANLAACVAAVHQHQPDAHIIVIWDAPPTGDPSVRDLWTVQNMLNRLAPDHAVVFRGKQPFVFARNMNIGINANDQEDVVLLNDDAILQSPNGFRYMQRDAEETTRIGLVSATTNVAGNPEQHRRPLIPGAPSMRIAGVCPGNSFPSVAFVCVFIPRRTISDLRAFDLTMQQSRQPVGPGPLDERFTAYGWEDNDFCRRLKLLGLRIGIHDGCYVDHGTLQSTFRGGAYAAGDINAGRKIYMDKWGTM